MKNIPTPEEAIETRKELEKENIEKLVNIIVDGINSSWTGSGSFVVDLPIKPESFVKTELIRLFENKGWTLSFGNGTVTLNKYYQRDDWTQR